ncbi:transposase [Hymenobacter lapidiphilus]|uniref:Transposase n=1 Tax=Hymenobacter lapidiphilus TaxID=2608003 RepID=A0A7Y7PM85_9BACT|nr:transposase [Hymenobacter lapidiphilus]NVO30414.1 transposase [Hymenobacter lapidiphilus]
MEPLPERRSIRYAGYDYDMAGYYSLTLCAQGKAHLFGMLPPDAPLQLSALGETVVAELLALADHYPTIRLDTWVLMPNHVHLLLALTHNRAVSVSQLVGSFKSRCYQEWRRALLAAGHTAPPSCWQRNYYERIIRSPGELEAQRHYILDNPSRWNTM